MDLGKINAVLFSDLGVIWDNEFPDISVASNWDEDLTLSNGYSIYKNFLDEDNRSRVMDPGGWVWTFGFGPRFILLGMPWQVDFAWQYNPIIHEFSSRRWYISIGLDF